MTREPNPLRRLDDALVPTLQRGTRRTVGSLGAPFLAAHRLEKRLLGGRPYQWAFRRRGAVRTLVVALVLAGSAVHLQRYPQLLEAREAERAAALRQSIRQPDAVLEADLPGGAVFHGPVVGEDAGDYVAARDADLADADADEERLAVVSFRGYLGTDAVLDALGTAEGEVVVLRAQYRLPDVEARPLETEVVRSELETSIERVIDEERSLIVEEEGALQELLDSGTMEDDAFIADARNRIDELRTIRNVLDATGGIVFAVVVRATVSDLRTIRQADDVRLVDLAPAGADEEGSILFGLRPDDVREVTFGVAPRR